MVETVIFSFAVIVLIAQIAVALLILGFLSDTLLKTTYVAKTRRLIAPHALNMAFFVALLASLGSLYLSEVAHIQPCILCWYQRIAMYPQALILYIAALKGDTGIRRYLIPVSSVGFVIALYHYVIQIVPFKTPLPCSTVGGVSCIEGYTFYFGYISIPLMAATAFLGIIIFLSFTKGKIKS